MPFFSGAASAARVQPVLLALPSTLTPSSSRSRQSLAKVHPDKESFEGDDVVNPAGIIADFDGRITTVPAAGAPSSLPASGGSVAAAGAGREMRPLQTR